MQQAQRDTAIKVTDQEIADGVEQQVRKVRGNFTSEVDYRNELKKAGFQTPEEYRRWLTDQQRRAALQNRLIDGLRSAGKLKPVAPTEQEMRTFFERAEGQPRHPPGDDLVPPDRDLAQAERRGQGPDAGAGRLDRAGAAARRRLRHRRPAVLPGPRIQGPGRLAQLVPPRGDGARVRAGGVRAQAGRGLGSGRVAVRLSHHPGRADAARRSAGPPHPADARRSIRPTWTARGRWPTRSARWSLAGALVRFAAADVTTTLGRRARGGERAGRQAARGLRQGDRARPTPARWSRCSL